MFQGSFRMKPIFSVLGLFLILTLAIGLTFIACSDDDDDDDNKKTDDDDAADDDSADDDSTDDDDATDDDVTDDDDDDDDDDSTPPTSYISVRFRDFLTSSPIEGGDCELVSTTSGNSFDPPVASQSDAEGYCKFNEKKIKAQEPFAFKFSKTAYVTTYGFNYHSELEWSFGMISRV